MRIESRAIIPRSEWKRDASDEMGLHGNFIEDNIFMIKVHSVFWEGKDTNSQVCLQQTDERNA